MKLKTIVNLWKTIEKLENVKMTTDFVWFLTKNKVAVKSEIKALDEAQKPSAIFLEYENKRVETAQRLSDKDITGNPRIQNGQYVIYEHKEEFEIEMKSLKQKFKDAIAEREKQLEEYTKLLERDIELNLVTIDFDKLPNTIDVETMEAFIEADLVIKATN